jgi:hypothetical protein
MNRHFLTAALLLSTAFTGLIFSACGKSSPASPPKELTAEEKRVIEGKKALWDKKAEYAKIPAKEQLAKEPYLKKGLVFYRFDKDKKGTPDEWQQNDFGTDKFGSSVSSEATKRLEFRLAQSPEEVGIVALMPECKSVRAGSYGSSAAFQEQCEVVLVDPELQAVVYRKTFAGELDSSKYMSGKESSVTARVDGLTVADFLYSLKSKTDSSPAKTNKK